MRSQGKKPECYIGLMSGTSIDGVDGVLVEFLDDVHEPVGARPDNSTAQISADGSGIGSEEAPNHRSYVSDVRCSTLAVASSEFPASLREELTALQSPGADELERAARASLRLVEVYAEVVERLIGQWRKTAVGATQVSRPAVRAIGAHGQTVRHRPAQGYTLQLMAGAALAERCGYDVICDFRSADVAAGGQGAPLVPAFHRGVFSSPALRRAIVNIGGIANVSLLAPGDPVRGFDTGPGNTLLDNWILNEKALPFDRDGAWAAQGLVDQALLEKLLADPYFAQPSPKSTHRDHFTLQWLASNNPGAAPEDVQATLSELTAASIAAAINEFGADEVYVCGGGARNADLMRRIARRVAPTPVQSTSALGIDPQAVEALAFAWLAHQRVNRLPGNEVGATGAIGTRVLGAWYPAHGG